MEQRLLQNQPETVQAIWEVDGELVTPTAPVTVTITRDSDGSAVVTNGSAAVVDGTDPGTTGTTCMTTYQLTAAQTATLDWLTCVWTDDTGRSVTTYADVTGGYLFSITAARQLSPLQDTTTYPTSKLLFYRMMAEEALEDIAAVAFVPRYRRDRAFIPSYGKLEVPRSKVTNVRQITTWLANLDDPEPGNVAQNQQPVPTLAGLQVVGTNQLFLPVLWSWWSLPIFVAYESGFVQTPPRVGRAAMLLMRRWIVESPWDERTTALHSAEGGSLSLLTADGGSSPFDIPEVQAIADAYGMPMIL